MDFFGIIGHSYSGPCGTAALGCPWAGEGAGPTFFCFLVPKLFFGTSRRCEALLRSGNEVPPHLGSAKRSLASNCVPKQELGNEEAVVCAVHADLRRPQAALWAIPAG